jgi:hypothetical protein
LSLDQIDFLVRASGGWGKILLRDGKVFETNRDSGREPRKDLHVWLDLGEVKNIAQVKLNGTWIWSSLEGTIPS